MVKSWALSTINYLPLTQYRRVAFRVDAEVRDGLGDDFTRDRCARDVRGAHLYSEPMARKQHSQAPSAPPRTAAGMAATAAVCASAAKR